MMDSGIISLDAITPPSSVHFYKFRFEWIFLCFWSYQGMVKGYSGVFRLGEATSTWDADSPVCILASLWWSAEHSSIKGLQMDRTYWMEFQEAIPNTNLLVLHLIMLLFDVAKKLYWNILPWKEVHHLISMYIIYISFGRWLNLRKNLLILSLQMPEITNSIFICQ